MLRLGSSYQVTPVHCAIKSALHQPSVVHQHYIQVIRTEGRYHNAHFHDVKSKRGAVCKRCAQAKHRLCGNFRKPPEADRKCSASPEKGPRGKTYPPSKRSGRTTASSRPTRVQAALAITSHPDEEPAALCTRSRSCGTLHCIARTLVRCVCAYDPPTLTAHTHGWNGFDLEDAQETVHFPATPEPSQSSSHNVAPSVKAKATISACPHAAALAPCSAQCAAADPLRLCLSSDHPGVRWAWHLCLGAIASLGGDCTSSSEKTLMKKVKTSTCRRAPPGSPTPRATSHAPPL